jgi:hypothetical protein
LLFVLKIAGVLLLTSALIEVATRFLLFSEVSASWGISRKLRSPSRFGSPFSDDLYFSMRARWQPAESYGQRPDWAPYYDARVGWTSNLFAPPEYENLDEPQVGERHLVLLFGDSFAACCSRRGRGCFQQLLRDAPQGERAALLNYGVPGHGLDQTYLLLDPVLDRHQARAPVVLLGVLVDEGLDRPLLAIREWPKPRLHAEQDELTVPDQPVPTVEEYLARDSKVPASYSAYILRRALFFSRVRGTAAQEAEKRQLARALVRAIVANLRQRGLRFCFVLFNGRKSLSDPSVLDWRQDLLRSELSSLSAPWVESRDEILAHARASGHRLDDYFQPEDAHYNEFCESVVFATILRGLDTAGWDLERSPPPIWNFETSLEVDGAAGGVLRYEKGANPHTGSSRAGDRLLLRGSDVAPTALRYKLAGKCRTLSATLWAFAPQALGLPVAISVVVDGAESWSGILEPSSVPEQLQVDLTQAHCLTISVSPRAGGSLTCAILEDVVLR